MGVPFYRQKPAAPAAFYNQPFGWAARNPLSKLTVEWVSGLFKVAQSRQLEDDGEWDQNES